MTADHDEQIGIDRAVSQTRSVICFMGAMTTSRVLHIQASERIVVFKEQDMVSSFMSSDSLRSARAFAVLALDRLVIRSVE